MSITLLAGSNSCIAEQTNMNDCYFEKKDWRLCKQEVRISRPSREGDSFNRQKLRSQPTRLLEALTFDSRIDGEVPRVLETERQ